MNQKIWNLFMLFLMLNVWACKDEKKTEDSKNTNMASDIFKNRIDSLVNRFESVWALLEQSDQSKFDNIRALAEEIKKGKTYDKNLLDSLPILEKKAIEAKFDHINMAEGSKIDQYDLAVEALMDAAKRLLASSPEAQKSEICTQLLERVYQLYDQDVYYRKEYDNAVREYNTLISTNAETLKTLGEKYATYQKLPVFTLAL